MIWDAVKNMNWDISMWDAVTWGIAITVLGTFLCVVGLVEGIVIHKIQKNSSKKDIGQLHKQMSDLIAKVDRFVEENPNSSSKDVVKLVHTLYEPYVTTGGIPKGGVGILTSVAYAEGDKKENSKAPD